MARRPRDSARPGRGPSLTQQPQVGDGAVDRGVEQVVVGPQGRLRRDCQAWYEAATVSRSTAGIGGNRTSSDSGATSGAASGVASGVASDWAVALRPGGSPGAGASAATGPSCCSLPHTSQRSSRASPAASRHRQPSRTDPPRPHRRPAARPGLRRQPMAGTRRACGLAAAVQRRRSGRSPGPRAARRAAAAPGRGRGQPRTSKMSAASAARSSSSRTPPRSPRS